MLHVSFFSRETAVLWTMHQSVKERKHARTRGFEKGLKEASSGLEKGFKGLQSFEDFERALKKV